ncbi:hypothetical protein [Streptomyces sp. DH10]|uniref:hypothetical protein n=1 Tax=Streptomyces sp. DH10 TaxID=3040121 RepID=UPI00244170D6|nr:hypothetical protein [Streptomyces sp. DH10]MDG9711354.1 hypothetical protein [Streptomyces sp. DH10]
MQQPVAEPFGSAASSPSSSAAALTLALGVLAVRWLPREERDTTAEVPDRQEQAVS